MSVCCCLKILSNEPLCNLAIARLKMLAGVLPPLMALTDQCRERLKPVAVGYIDV